MNDIKQDFKALARKRKSAKEILMNIVLTLCAVYTVYSIFYPEQANWQNAIKEKQTFKVASLQPQDYQRMITILSCQSLCCPF